MSETVLIVDDDPVQRRLLDAMVRRFGYQALVAEGGDAALALLGGAQRIDGVVLDDPELTVPHPRWRERRFVMAPLAELAPDLADPTDVADAGGEVAVVGTL